MIDFHCHLDLYPNGLKLAREVNDRNNFTLVVTTSPRAYYATSRVFADLRNIQVALGLHPEVAESKSGEIDALIAGISSTRFIGEIGMDGSARFRKSIDLQERIFKAVLDECSKQEDRVLSIHSRGAAGRVLEMIATKRKIGIPILHWFSGGLSELQLAIKLGCWFSVGPAMLATEKGRGLVSRMPIDCILPETDGPFTSTNSDPLMPWDAWRICDHLSVIWNQPRSLVEEQLKENSNRLLTS